MCVYKTYKYNFRTWNTKGVYFQAHLAGRIWIGFGLTVIVKNLLPVSQIDAHLIRKRRIDENTSDGKKNNLL